MSGNIFVDTNILRYARDASEPEKQAMAVVRLDELWENRTGRLSVQVLNEYFVNVTRTFSVQGRYHLSWWDSMIVAEGLEPQ